MCYGCRGCGKCGKVVSYETPPANRTCWKCGRETDDPALSTCPGCGTKLPPVVLPLPGPRE